MDFRLQLNNYLQTSWSGQFEVNPLDSEEFKVVTMEDQEARDDDSSDGQPIKHLSLSVHTKQDGVKHGGGSRDVYIYSKYWLINKTGLPLQIRVSFYPYTDVVNIDFVLFVLFYFSFFCVCVWQIA